MINSYCIGNKNKTKFLCWNKNTLDFDYTFYLNECIISDNYSLQNLILRRKDDPIFVDNGLDIVYEVITTLKKT